MTLVGEHSASIDSKGRLAIPSYFRKSLTDSVVIAPVLDTPDDEPVLRVYTLTKWQQVETSVRQMPNTGGHARAEQVRRFQRELFSISKMVEIDGSGRVLLSPRQREILGESRTQLIGMSDKLEIWAEGYWKKYHRTWMDQSPEERFNQLDLGGLSL